jgi:hypothetical protein
MTIRKAAMGEVLGVEKSGAESSSSRPSTKGVDLGSSKILVTSKLPQRQEIHGQQSCEGI